MTKINKKIQDFAEEKGILGDLIDCLEDLEKFQKSDKIDKIIIKQADYSILCTIYYQGEPFQDIFKHHRMIVEYMKDTYPSIFGYVLFVFDRSDIRKMSHRGLKLKPVCKEISNIEFEIQEVIYAKMEIMGVSKEQVTEALNMDLASFCWMFTGGNIDLKTMVKISNILALDLEVLFREVTEI